MDIWDGAHLLLSKRNEDFSEPVCQCSSTEDEVDVTFCFTMSSRIMVAKSQKLA